MVRIVEQRGCVSKTRYTSVKNDLRITFLFFNEARVKTRDMYLKKGRLTKKEIRGNSVTAEATEVGILG